VTEKLFAARMAGMRRAIVPAENLRDVSSDLRGLDVVGVADVFEALDALDMPRPAMQPQE
jgi:ATP-dependent Lon protease